MAPSDFEYHQKASGEYQCNQCHAIEWSKKKIRLHLQKHSRPFGCKKDSCVKSFATKAHLQRHEDIHSRTKTIVCALCPNPEKHEYKPWFCRRVDHLQRHLLRKHKITPKSVQSLAAQYMIMLEQERDRLLQLEGRKREWVKEYFSESGNELTPIIFALGQRIDEGAAGVPIIEGHKISPGRSKHLRLVFLGTTDEGTLDQLRSRIDAQYVLPPQDEAPLATTAGLSLNTASGIAEHPRFGSYDTSTG